MFGLLLSLWPDRVHHKASGPGQVGRSLMTWPRSSSTMSRVISLQSSQTLHTLSRPSFLLFKIQRPNLTDHSPLILHMWYTHTFFISQFRSQSTADSWLAKVRSYLASYSVRELLAFHFDPPPQKKKKKVKIQKLSKTTEYFSDFQCLENGRSFSPSFQRP